MFTAEHGWWSENTGGDNGINVFPKTAEEARAQVRAVKALGIDRIMIVYDSMMSAGELETAAITCSPTS